MLHHKKAHPLAKLLAIYLMAILTMVALAGTSGCGPSARDKALSQTLLGVNAARDGFLVWEDKHENAIIDACDPPACTYAEGQAKLDAYRLRAVVVVQAFAIAYQAISVGAINKNTSLPEVISAAAGLYAAIKELQSSASTPVPTSP